ncbi:NYN domain-containing protein [Bordetella flabilis]|uniref:HTH OST-type domain-containing protein n=1 Tax=Bordetella flabilis TaxID=463014 RepID=A0A193GAG1_9BORD|nr:NYN domain-containing protein [Bordetella flabilis]ANN76618.1 hypothetical protein BAU07_05335 [Bordetella flabilis]
MISPHDNVSMALFCDFENVALGVRDANYEKFDIRLVLERLLLKGSIVIKKSYCDWDRYKAFKAPMHEANFELIEIPHVRQSGKNSADIRLVVDALDLCYTKSHVNTFVIISGDSDFSPLVSKLRENAKHVIGVGVKQSTSDLLIANCDEFIFYDDLVRESARSTSRRAARDNGAGRRAPEDDKRRKEDVEARRTQAVDMAVETFDALVAERGDSGKMWASVLKEAIKRRKPDFNESYYGFRAFGNLLEEAQSRGLLEVGRDEKSGTYVYRAQAAAGSARNGGFDDMAGDRMEMRAPAETRNGSALGGVTQAELPASDHAGAAPAAGTPASPAAGPAGSRRRGTRGGRSGRKNQDVQTTQAETARQDAAEAPQDTATTVPWMDAAPITTAADAEVASAAAHTQAARSPAAGTTADTVAGTAEDSNGDTTRGKRAGANTRRRTTRTPAATKSRRGSASASTEADTVSSDTSGMHAATDAAAAPTHRDSAVQADATPPADDAPKAARKSPARTRRPRKTATPAVES